MLVVDTEFLFALNSRNPKHKHALKILREHRGELIVPDTVLFEFLVVLRSYGKNHDEIRDALKALKKIFTTYEINEAHTIDTHLLIIHVDLMSRYELTFFDSLIAASALILGKTIISDDKDFDKVPGLKRISLT